MAVGPFAYLAQVIGRIYHLTCKGGNLRLDCLSMPEEIKRKIQEELRQLEAELRTEIPQELKKAVAMGDLSENAEYEAARNRQDYVRARIANLRKRMGDLAMIDVSRMPTDRAAY